MAIKAVDSLFVDTNVLIFANVAESPLHKRAFSLLKEYRESGCALWISSQVLREYLAVRSRAEFFRKASSLDLLVERVKTFESIFTVAFDSPATMERLRTLLKTVNVSGKQVHDANIVATMLAHNLKYLLTDNTEDFKRFSSLVTVLPLSE